MQDPEAFLEQIGMEPPTDPIEPGRPAVLDAAHRARINHDTWFFADLSNRARFLDDPLPWVDTLTDPVSGERFRSRPDSPTVVHDGRTWYFARSLTRTTFRLDPSRFLEARARRRG